LLVVGGRNLRARWARSAALGAGIFVAAVGFVLLASSSRTGELRVRGTVAQNFRAAYDILVRPKGSYTPLERREALVNDNYLSGIFGGITMRDYTTIREMRGVQIAAPIANVGYMLVDTQIPISIGRFLNRSETQLYRLRVRWVADDGTSVYPGGSLYVYYSRNHKFSGKGGTISQPDADGRPLPVCTGFYASEPVFYGPFDPAERTGLTCYSARSPQTARLNYTNYGRITFPIPRPAGTVIDAYIPVLVAAIDPSAEARLVGINRAIVSGRYLAQHSRPRLRFAQGLGAHVIPVIASSVPFVGEKLDVSVERLTTPRGAHVPAILASDDCHDHPTKGRCPGYAPSPPSPSHTSAYPFLTHLAGLTVGHLSLPVANAYRHALTRDSSLTGDYWTTTPVRYQALASSTLAPRTVKPDPLTTWLLPSYGELNGGFYEAPPDNQDVQFRRLIEHVASTAYSGSVAIAPHLQVVGSYDPRHLQGFSALSHVPMQTYYPPILEPGDARSRRLLHGHALEPDQNLGGYIQQSPLVLTSLSALKPLLSSAAYSNLTPREIHAPISVIRIRVAGVTGDDALSRARIRLVAEQIHQKTGLSVDITAGSSATPITIDLPAGAYGRPALRLNEGWTKKGVAVAYLNAVDRFSLLVFTLILAVCALFLANGALAATKARRGEFGTLLTIGWAPRHVFGMLLIELTVIGAVAGTLGSATAAILVTAFNLHLSILEVLAVIPTATLLAALSGLIPAWRATRGQPVDALRPATTTATHTRRIHGLPSLAIANLARVPLRTALGSSGLAIGVAGTAILIAAQRAFQGELVTSVLGDAISVQVRSVDELSAALTVILAACSLADVIYLNLREREAELATLVTVGWTTGHIRRLIMLETLALALLGSIVGALAATLGGTLLLGLPLTSLMLGSALGGLSGVAIAELAALLPLARIARLAPAAILAQEV
jgi:ABC-type antimicrobial peptide transport system permease subunit